MKIRDVSVKIRLLTANFLMIFVPVLLLLSIGGVLLAGLRLTGPAKLGELTLMWPEQGPALSIQFAVSSLRLKLERISQPDLNELLEDCHLLESQGINTVILRDKNVLYLTPGTDSEALQKQVTAQLGEGKSLLNWNDQFFIFYYQAAHTNLTVMASGELPFLAQETLIKGSEQEYLEKLLFGIFALAVGIIVFLGICLSRWLSIQIIEPLLALKRAAAAVQAGNLDLPLEVNTKDELGETCAAFEQMRQELKVARERQQKYEKNRKTLIATISHDLSTPLTSLKGYACGILDGIANTTDKRQHYVQMIFRTACSMESLVESLFIFSKLDLRQIPFFLEKVSLYHYFWDFTVKNKDTLAQQGLRLSFPQASFFPLVQIDRLQFQRIMDNLLSNCAKYKKGSQVDVQITLSKEKDQVKIAVSDNGVGVADEDLPKLFESFYRTDTARTNVAKGSGLGLAIVKQIITCMNGTVWAEATPGGGLTVCLYLPLVAEEKDEENIDY